MPSNYIPKEPTNPFKEYDREQLSEYLRSAKPARKPGEGYEYSNLAVGLLGDLLSQQAGVSYEELLRVKITEPLECRILLSTLQRTSDSFLPRLTIRHCYLTTPGIRCISGMWGHTKHGR